MKDKIIQITNENGEGCIYGLSASGRMYQYKWDLVKHEGSEPGSTNRAWTYWHTHENHRWELILNSPEKAKKD